MIRRENLMSVLSGVYVAFTGKMSRKRTDMEFEAHDLGAIPEERVTRHTNWLVTGKRPGKTKTNKASEYGTQVLSEREYRERIAELKRQAREETEAEEQKEAPDEAAMPIVMETPEWIKRLRGKSPVGF
jgi:BRCT domain type II-containing protein